MVKELYAGGSATADVGEGAAARKGVMKLFSVWFGLVVWGFGFCLEKPKLNGVVLGC